MRTATAVLAFILVAGIAGRLVRYGAPAPNKSEQVEAQVQGFLEARGWQAGQRIGLTNSGSHSAIAYRKDGCGEPLLVSSVGAGSDAASLFERDSRKWLFIRDGEPSNTPQTIAFVIDAAIASFSGRQAAPILGVAIPASSKAACAPPPFAEWKGLHVQQRLP